MAFTVVIDANVLYSNLLRDLLIRIAQTGIYRAHWTECIEQEWSEALSKNRPDIPKEKLGILIQKMRAAVPDCLVYGFEYLIDSLELPDPKDRHVLAAAIRSHAEGIITYNLKHFPQDVCSKHCIDVLHPDDFVLCQIDLNAGAVITAIQNLIADFKAPISGDDFLIMMEKNGLTKSAAKLRDIGLHIPALETKALHNNMIH